MVDGSHPVRGRGGAWLMGLCVSSSSEDVVDLRATGRFEKWARLFTSLLHCAFARWPAGRSTSPPCATTTSAGG